MSGADVKSHASETLKLHPLPLRIMHWVNAIAVIIMITSGWKIYNDEVIFGWLHFPEAITLGKWAQHGLQWHFFGMWILAINGLVYLIYGFVTGRLRENLLPIRPSEVIATVGDALRFRLKHDDRTHYNAVQKVLYVGIILVGIVVVISGLAIWKPSASYSVIDQNARTGGIASRSKWRTYRLPPSSGRPASSPRLSG